ncbi:MAG: hypothetical protein EOP11_19715 [Proteobacteria bacterium]|nr:MAG: hypothetical protein EOP11_19715 [Pseudomonadota bacterium]
MKVSLMLILALGAPTLAFADGRAQFDVEIDAVGCVYSASNEFENCFLLRPIPKERPDIELERTTFGEWAFDSKEWANTHSLEAPALAKQILVDVTIYVRRDPNFRKSNEPGYGLGALIGLPPAPGEIRSYPVATFTSLPDFREFSTDAKAVPVALPDGKRLDINPKLRISNLSVQAR